jgi:hypothetical protein
VISRMRNIKLVFEAIDEQTGEYVKKTYEKIERYGFYLRFAHDNFIPCRECQEEIERIIWESSEWTLGNKDYDPPIELWKFFEIDDNSWLEVERRKATKEELATLQGRT